MHVLLVLILIALVILIGVLVVVIVNRKNKERLARIVEGKEDGRHSNLPEVGTTIKGVATALIIFLLCINIFVVTTAFNQNYFDNQAINQNINQLNSRLDDLEILIKDANCPYIDAKMEITSFDEAKGTATISYSLKLKESAEDTKVIINYANNENLAVELERTESSVYVGTYEVSVFDTATYYASLSITTGGITTSCEVEEFTLEFLPLEMFSFYWITAGTENEYDDKKNEVSVKGRIEATKGTGKIDNIESVYLVYKVDDVEVDRVQLDDTSKNNESYFIDVDKKFGSNNYEVFIETNLANGYKFQAKDAWHFSSDVTSSAETILLVSPEGKVLAGF